MNVYYRYFQIKDEATLAKIDVMFAARKAQSEGADKIKEQIGAKSVYFYSRGGSLAGFGFDSTPDLAVFKKVENDIYYPKKSTKAGKDICAQISKLPKVEPIDDALKVSGLHPFFCLSGEATRSGFRMHSASICGSDKAGWFAVVPWRDEDPKVLEEYKAERSAGTRGRSELDHLLWTPPAEWVEVKEWEMKKALDEAKSA